jgi:hypothetical protein
MFKESTLNNLSNFRPSKVERLTREIMTPEILTEIAVLEDTSVLEKCGGLKELQCVHTL